MKRPWMLFEWLQTTSKGFENLFVIFGKIEGFIAILERLRAKIWILESFKSKCNFRGNGGQNMNIREFWVKMQYWGKTRVKIWILESSGSKCNFGEKPGQNMNIGNFWGLNVNVGKLSMRKRIKMQTWENGLNVNIERERNCKKKKNLDFFNYLGNQTC